MPSLTQRLTNLLRGIGRIPDTFRAPAGRCLRAGLWLTLAPLCHAQVANLQVPDPTDPSPWTSGSHPKAATTSITTSGTLSISGTAVATFMAGAQINLEPGFTADGTSGATFHAYIAPTAPITFQSSPSGISIQVDGATYPTPVTLQLFVGSTHAVGVASPQSGGAGTQYTFANWSDGQGASHTITVPSSSATFTANFTTQYYLTTTASPAAGGTIAPPSGWYTPGTILVGATANPGYQFTGFSAPPGGATTPQNLTINAPVTVTAFFQPLPSVLTITSTHSGDFTQGQAGATYSLTVGNAVGAGPTSGTVMVTEFTPTGLLPVSMSGTGWTCTAGGTTCTRGDALGPGSSYPVITATFNVSSNALPQVTNQATVSGGGSASAAASDPTTVDALLRYSNPLAFATSASVVAGVPTTLTVTYTSDNGPSDIASGQVMIDNCYLAWDYTGHVILYGANGGGQVNGTLGQITTPLSAGNCSINLAISSLSPLASNPKALVLSLAITFPEQAYPSPDGRTTPPTFVGTHEVYAWGTSAENLPTSQVDLGSLVVSQGQDFTLTLGTSESPINLGTGASLSLALSATGLNGFTGNIPVNTQIVGGTGGCFVFMGSPPTSIAANSQTTITVRNNNCTSGYMNFIVAGTAASGIFHSTSYVTLEAVSTGDFNIGVGAPTPAVLTPQSYVSYTVTVTPTNGLTGCVNLSLNPSGVPAGVTSSVSPSQVCLNGSGSMTSNLNLQGSPTTPPGTWPLQVVGALAGGAQHTAAFSLSTLVTTFQVTSATGSAIVHNTGQEVQTVHSVTAGNVPTNATCAPVPADPNVTCRVVSSSPGTVTIGITAGTGAVHGTRVLSLNGGAAPVMMAVADFGAGETFSLPPITAQAGGPYEPYTFTGLPDLKCVDMPEPCGTWLMDPGDAPGWIGVFGLGDWLSVYATPAIGDSTGPYSYTARQCDAWDPSNFSCLTAQGEVDVTAPLLPAVQVTSGPTPIMAYANNLPADQTLYCIPIQANGQPDGGAFSWTTSSQSVTLLNANTATVTVCSVAGKFSQNPGDVAVNVTYTVGGVPSPAATTTLTVLKPTTLVLNPGTDTTNPTGHTCIQGVGGFTATQSYYEDSLIGARYNSYVRYRIYSVQDQFTNTIQANMTLNESYAPSQSNVQTGSGTGKGASDYFFYCSQTCRQGGSDSAAATQTITANNFTIATKAVTWTCAGVAIQD